MYTKVLKVLEKLNKKKKKAGGGEFRRWGLPLVATFPPLARRTAREPHRRDSPLPFFVIEGIIEKGEGKSRQPPLPSLMSPEASPTSGDLSKGEETGGGAPTDPFPHDEDANTFDNLALLLFWKFSLFTTRVEAIALLQGNVGLRR
ncbi:hypothetical protein CRG98_046611 [Punica granatum]|uniref:Uncharacterized protein n=1 Tax=Punica granatum TaxID=22663 RepID=A0A2I0HP11_PUNGR|nr:hypothetical protein CRG98_046611 [Punica granatum]